MSLPASLFSTVVWLSLSLAPGPSLRAVLSTQAPVAQEPKPATAPAPASPVLARGPRVVLEGLDGVSRTVPLEGFDTTDPRKLGAHILRFEGAAKTAPAPATEGQANDRALVVLAGGQKLHGKVRRGEGETLDVEIVGGVHVRTSIEDVSSLYFAARVPATWHGALEPAKEGDRLYRRQRDVLERIEGGVEEFGAKGLRFHDERVGSLEIQWSEVVALFIESASKTESPAKGADAVPVVVDLTDESRLAGRLERIDSRGLALELVHGQKLVLPLDVLALVVVDDRRLVFLSDLAPASAADASPFGDDLGMRWPHRVDRSVTGSALVAGGRGFSRGIGVHSPSRITWKLGAKYESLRGLVAIDDQVLRLPSRGSVVFRVLVDGQKRWESPVVRGGDAPLAIALEPKALAGANELVLEVDTAEDAYVADRADWLQLVLVKAP
jgi:hypothetical protein